jgi:hypothetical protein
LNFSTFSINHLLAIRTNQRQYYKNNPLNHCV